MQVYLLVTFLIISSSYLVLGDSGTVELNEYSFDKIVNKFGATLVKFDVAFPYGDKHDAFIGLAKEAKDVSDLLFAEVGVKDYGVKENEELAKKYSATKDNFPVVKLFLKGSEPIVFDDAKGFTSDNLRRFVRDKSGIYLSLPGCIKSLDTLAIKFQNSGKEDKEKILNETDIVLEKLKSEDIATGLIYKKIMHKVLEKGDEFIKTEMNRVNKLLSTKVSTEKKKEIASRINILQSFTFSSGHIKDEF